MGEILATPGAVRRLIEAYGFRLKKSLGQNFLVDRNILDKIIRVAELQPSDIVLEIGPGVGGLTQALAEAGAFVVAVEIDRNLVAILGEVLADYPQIRVVHGDALQLPLAELLPAGRACRVVANLPYYITSPLLLKLFEEQLPLSMAVVMVQREVAQRIVAKPGSKEYGALSVAIAYHAEAEIVASVSRSVFFPPPNVDSSVLRLLPRPFPYPAADAATFSTVVRAAFGQRRKTLRNALRTAVNHTSTVLERAAIDGNRRGETLSPAEFGQLSLACVGYLKT
jgi:16S rRNA (adenine1518-N6/adenine1519-N6)-dimethyltransferase